MLTEHDPLTYFKLMERIIDQETGTLSLNFRSKETL